MAELDDEDTDQHQHAGQPDAEGQHHGKGDGQVISADGENQQNDGVPAGDQAAGDAKDDQVPGADCRVAGFDMVVPMMMMVMAAADVDVVGPTCQALKEQEEPQANNHQSHTQAQAGLQKI